MTEPDYMLVSWDGTTLEAFYGPHKLGQVREIRPGVFEWRQGGPVAYTLRGAATAMAREHLNRVEDGKRRRK